MSNENVKLILDALEGNPVKAFLQGCIDKVVELINKNDESIAAVQRAGETDPTNMTYVDSRWKIKAAEGKDKQLKAWEEEYQAAIALSEERLLQMRARVIEKGYIEPTLTEEQKIEKRKQINEGKVLIDNALNEFKAYDKMAQDMCSLVPNFEFPEGGLTAGLPKPKSLVVTRATRKSSNVSGETRHKTAIAWGKVNGELAGKTLPDGTIKYKFATLADKVSELRMSSLFAANAVTDVELEEAYFASNGVTSLKGADMPMEHAFTFSKKMIVNENNSDSTTEVDFTCTIEVQRALRGIAAQRAKESAVAEEGVTP